jgi:hypothetical protein
MDTDAIEQKETKDAKDYNNIAPGYGIRVAA